MARKTKQEALLTRGAILDAAERVFLAQGVAGTSLQDIAATAGVTRGAVYWHFKDKSELFNAMMSRVVLPIEQSTAALGDDAAQPVPALLRRHLLDILERVVGDAQVRRVFEIATHKVEYVDATTKVRERHVEIRHQYLATIERLLRRGQRRGEVSTAQPARHLAIGLHALLDGLIHNWVLDPQAFDLRRVGARALGLHLSALQPASPAPAPARPRRQPTASTISNSPSSTRPV